jgi:uroporphyrinogen-III decarboxylase
MSVHDILERRRPERIAYAPNYWQWFAHRRNHGSLPAEIAHCRDQLELIQELGLDVFSRNIYCDEQRGWFGGLCEVTWNGGEREWAEGRDRIIERTYGPLTERLRYVFQESTLVQERFAVSDYASQLDGLEALLTARRWRFVPERYAALQGRVGACGVGVAGELHSPLKMLHLLLGPQDTTYCLMDYPERTAELLALHEAAQLDLVRQMAKAGVRVMMSMDNLDTAFHPPHYVEQYSASFYEKASRICHEHGSLFFIHACGRQRDNLRLIASLGVDGLEGVAFPTLGDVDLDEAMRLSGDRLIITGGISAQEFERLHTREAVFAYVRELFERMRPYAHRFMFSASCNTPYTAPWQTLVWFRDAWREYAE